MTVSFETVVTAVVEGSYQDKVLVITYLVLQTIYRLIFHCGNNLCSSV